MTQRYCPECGEEATDESKVRERLSDLGYHHRDEYYQCSNGHEWKHGTPLGECDNDTWRCPGCDGDMIPHFGSIVLQDDKLDVRPKCAECHYIPDEAITLPVDKAADTQGRVFFGHHLVTGDRSDAEEL